MDTRLDVASLAAPIRLQAPWPPREASPNWSGHWRCKHRALKSYAFAAGLVLGPQISRQTRPWLQAADPIEVAIAMFPPPAKRGAKARARDHDNALGSCKRLLDVVARMLGVDDRLFRPRLVIGDPVDGGRVDLVLQPFRVGD
jgi:crossover junction endodeoxyribonuclease RusA